MSYTTIDRTETPHRKVDVLIPSELPEFKTPANPLSQLEGPGVFTLDERNALDALGLAGEPAGALIEASFRRCRHSVDGRVIRQRLVVTRCVIVSYAYEHAGRRHVIHVNPAHGLVEDLSGPIQQGVDRVMQAARGAFAAGQHEEAFFHVQKLLCMSGSKKEAQALRKAVIGKLAIHYLGWGLSGWGLTSGLLGLFPGTATDAGAPWTWVLGLLPLGLGVWILARDIALGFSRRRARPPLGFLLGVLAAVSCAEDWRFVLPGVLAVFAIVALVRRKERKRRLRIEDRVESFGGVTPLEHYLKNFQKDGPGARTWMLGLGLASVLLLVGQLFLPWDTSSRIRVTLRGERGGRPELDADSRGNHFVVPEIGLEMVPVPAGVFHMGSQSGDDNERPVTEVRISSPYWLGRHEVTQSEWSAIMGASPARWTGGRLPIECVSWEDAMSFCRALTQRERAAGRLPEGFAYTLPTEAQWEHACRAGTDEMYPGNGDADAAGWYESNSDARTHPVGLKRPNRWGLHDMHGNVAEWCLDWYADRLPGGGATDPTGATSGAFRVVRGGGWYGDANYARSTYRGGGDPAARVPLIGFRVALCVSAEG